MAVLMPSIGPPSMKMERDFMASRAQFA
jgi:hypothetical protein